MRRTHGLICSTIAATALGPIARAQLDLSDPAVDAAAEQRLLQTGGPGFRIKRTDRFFVAYNTRDDAVRHLLSRLRATHRHVYHFCKINDIPATPLEHRLGVLFFNTHREYLDYAAKEGFGHGNSAGFYSQRSNISAFYNLADSPMLLEINDRIERLERQIEALEKDRPRDRARLRKLRRQRQKLTNVRQRTVERLNRLTVQHEAAHQILFNAGIHARGVKNPGWLVEGLACLFETPPSASGSGPGATNQIRLADFRSVCGAVTDADRLRAADIEVALAAGKFRPLRELVGKADLFDKAQDPNLVHYYTQAWSWVLYLQRNKRRPFAEYLTRLSKRMPDQQSTPEAEIAEFEAAFGPIDDRLQDRWARFILEHLPFKPSELK
ncbi:MAG: DUF1570 domain-containing protein [Phycisphaerae bacterium]